MRRKIEVWDSCYATRYPTHLVVEKVLSNANPVLDDTQYIEVILSTPHWGDIEKIQHCCSPNLMLSGKTEQVLYDVQIVSHVLQRNDTYTFTISAELWL